MTTTTEDPNINDQEAIDIESIQGSPSDSVRAGFPLLPPGIYISSTRTIGITAKRTDDGVPYIAVKLAFGPFLDEAGEPVKQKPPLCNLNTLPRKDGSLTSLADYLAAFGIDARLLVGSALVESINETAEKPVKVRTGIEEDWKERPAGARAKRDEFFKNAAGKYVSEAVDPSDGRVVKGWANVYGFRKY